MHHKLNDSNENVLFLSIKCCCMDDALRTEQLNNEIGIGNLGFTKFEETNKHKPMIIDTHINGPTNVN